MLMTLNRRLHSGLLLAANDDADGGGGGDPAAVPASGEGDADPPASPPTGDDAHAKLEARTRELEAKLAAYELAEREAEAGDDPAKLLALRERELATAKDKLAEHERTSRRATIYGSILDAVEPTKRELVETLVDGMVAGVPDTLDGDPKLVADRLARSLKTRFPDLFAEAAKPIPDTPNKTRPASGRKDLSHAKSLAEIDPKDYVHLTDEQWIRLSGQAG